MAGLGFLKDTILENAGQTLCVRPEVEIGVCKGQAGLAFPEDTIFPGRLRNEP